MLLARLLVNPHKTIKSLNKPCLYWWRLCNNASDSDSH